MTAYVIFIREETIDQGELDTYRAKLPAVLANWPIEILSGYGKMEVLEGPDPVGVVLVSFPTMERASEWYHSEEYQAIARHRLAGGKYRALLVDGT